MQEWRIEMMNIVLLEPEIPANTGNIGRTCVATGTRLHLIEPLGFRLDEKELKRAGLDYWKDLDVTVYSNFQDFLDRNGNPKIYMATTKAKKIYSDMAFEKDCYIWERECRDSRGDSFELSRNCNSDTNEFGNTVFESVKFCCDCFI